MKLIYPFLFVILIISCKKEIHVITLKTPKESNIIDEYNHKDILLTHLKYLGNNLYQDTVGELQRIYFRGIQTIKGELEWVYMSQVGDECVDEDHRFCGLKKNVDLETFRHLKDSFYVQNNTLFMLRYGFLLYRHIFDITKDFKLIPNSNYAKDGDKIYYINGDNYSTYYFTKDSIKIKNYKLITSHSIQINNQIYFEDIRIW